MQLINYQIFRQELSASGRAKEHGGKSNLELAGSAGSFAATEADFDANYDAENGAGSEYFKIGYWNLTLLEGVLR
jgi:hypothetical protein